MSEHRDEQSKYDTLKEIDIQQVILLKRKAKFLEHELLKTNLIISHTDDINSSMKETLEISPYKNKNHSKNQFKLNLQINSISNKKILLASITLLVLSVGLIGNFDSSFDDALIENIATTQSLMKSKFVIENLRGDTIDTMKSWRILPDDALNINLLNGDELTLEQYNAVVNVITSMDSIELDDYLLNKGQMGSESTYYLGWAGAMTEAQKNETVYTIPTNYNLIQSSNAEGQIVIDFSNLIDVDGFSGYTRSVLDNGEILKSYIIIYDVDNLDASELATILRHEFGHALGLGHSTDPEDLMAPLILTDFPYISECDVDAMAVLYNGYESGMAVCEK